MEIHCKQESEKRQAKVLALNSIGVLRAFQDTSEIKVFVETFLSYMCRLQLNWTPRT